MAQPATKIIDQMPAAIDRGHLTRMTFGDRSLEREVLELFDRQAELLLARMRGGDPQAMAALAHTLKGSAVGIGAGNVARAAASGRAGAVRPSARPRSTDAGHRHRRGAGG